MSLLDKIAKLLHIASGKKMVTYVGLIISSASAACLQLGDAWLNVTWIHHVCGAAVFVGGIIMAFGKALGDRRVDPEVQEIVPEERREPKIDG